METTIGVFAGSASSFNVTRLLSNVGESLSGTFTTHLIATNQTATEEMELVYDEIHGRSKGDSLKGTVTSLRSYLQSYRPDVLFQVTSPPVHGTIVGTFAKKYGIPFVYRYSGDRFYEYQLARGLDKPLHFGLNNILGRYPLHLADAFVALGPTGASRLRARGASRSKISIIPPVVDQEQFTPTGPSADLETDRNVALFVGRLSRKKGKETLERTLPAILNRRPDLQFVFVGEQTERLDLPTQYEDHVTFVGPIPPAEVPQYYRAAAILIHPSLSEGLPRAVLEALATETPPVARDVGDVAYATDNTFQTDSEFVEMVCDFETLEIGSVDEFSYDSVKARYLRLFGNM